LAKSVVAVLRTMTEPNYPECLNPMPTEGQDWKCCSRKTSAECKQCAAIFSLVRLARKRQAKTPDAMRREIADLAKGIVARLVVLERPDLGLSDSVREVLRRLEGA
jgi:hypothetical protein